MSLSWVLIRPHWLAFTLIIIIQMIFNPPILRVPPHPPHFRIPEHPLSHAQRHLDISLPNDTPQRVTSSSTPRS